MEGLISVAFVGWVVATAALALTAIGAPIRWARRLTLVSILPVALGLGGWIMLALMTGPKPHSLEWRSGETALVARDWVEGEAIYLWVRWPDENAPRAYRLPWSEETAQQIEEAERAAEEEGGETVVEFRERFGDEAELMAESDLDSEFEFEFSLEQRQPPSIYALPQPTPAPKPITEQEPVYNFGESDMDDRS